MATTRILVVDDEEDLCEILKFNLEIEGYDVDTAFSAEEALKKDICSYNLLLLDVMMGEMSGFKMARALRENPATASTPIIFLTAKDTENDMLTGFSVGGDDYIPKPFSIKEVIARVKAVLKRSGASSNNLSTENVLSVGGLAIDFELKEVFIDGDKIELTKTEFEVLSLLARNPEKLFSRERMIDTIWRESPYVTERTVDVHIARLRKKMKKYANLITNRSGYGYRFNTENL